MHGAGLAGRARLTAYAAKYTDTYIQAGVALGCTSIKLDVDMSEQVNLQH